MQVEEYSKEYRETTAQIIGQSDADKIADVLCVLSNEMESRILEMDSLNVNYVRHWSELDDRRIENALRWLEEDGDHGFIRRYNNKDGLPVVQIIKEGCGYRQK